MVHQVRFVFLKIKCIAVTKQYALTVLS